MAAQNTRPNPYVGPRAFQTGERLYGRDLESRQLLDLLKSERIVLLHSPSGAGKSSLIYADLIPKLEADGFDVLPVTRVNLEPPGGLAQRSGLNRYVLSLLVSLEEAAPRDQCRPAEQLAELSLSEYLSGSLAEDPAAGDAGALPQERVLIIDQFEEILTVDPADQEGKRAFFRQLGAALYDDRRLWALFAIREDYMPALDPYLRPIPTRLSNTYRLDLLGADAARQAIQRPPGDVGVAFDGSTAQMLVDDLRRIRVQQPDGAVIERLGAHVEPLQLQVVCYRLWESLSPDDMLIDQEDLVAMGDVDRSLEEYYAERVAAAAAQADVPERAIREWFNRHLITESGLRGQVLMGAEETGDLDNRAVGLLRNAYLVRTEQRGGRTWCELSHDRMVEPVRRNNAAWLQAHLSLVQRQAAMWLQHGRPPGMLVRGDELANGLRWAQAHQDELTEEEDEFIRASQKAAEQEQRERELREEQLRAAQQLAAEQKARAEEQQRAAKRLSWLVAGLAVVFVLALAAAIVAVTREAEARAQRARAQRQRQVSLAQSLAVMASNTNNDDGLTALLAVEAFRVMDEQPGPVAWLIDGALREALSQPHFSNTLFGHDDEVVSVAFSPDSQWLASSSADQTVRLWDVNNPQVQTRVLQGQANWIWSVAFSPDGRWLAAGSEDATIWLWDMGNLDARPRVLSDHAGAVRSIAFSPDGRWLASGSTDETVRVWDVSALGTDQGDPPAATHVLGGHEGRIWSVTFSPDGRWLASSSGSQSRIPGAVRLWDMEDLSVEPRVLRGHRDAVLSVAFSPDGRWLATGSEDWTVQLWDVEAVLSAGKEDDPVPPRTMRGHSARVWSVAFSPDGQQLASSSYDWTVRLWDVPAVVYKGVDDPAAYPVVLEGHQAVVWSVAYSADGEWLATGSRDYTVRLWSRQDPPAEATELRRHGEATTSVAFSADRRWLAVGNADSTVRLWDLANLSTVPRVLKGHEAPVWSVAFDPEGRWLASGSGDRTVRLWDMGSLEATPHILRDHEDQVWSVAFSADGRWLASGSTDEKVRLWDVSGLGAGVATPIGQPYVLEGHEGAVSSVAFDPKGRWLASGSVDKTVQLWDLPVGTDESGSPMHVLSSKQAEVTSVAFSLDGRWLASGGDDSTVQVWNISTLDEGTVDVDIEPSVLRGHEDGVTSVAFDPDGKWLASGSDDRTVRLWDVSTLGTDGGELPAEPYVLGHRDKVLSVTFGPDGQLASGSGDKRVRLWDALALREIEASQSVVPRSLIDYDSVITSLSLSPDGRLLAVGGTDRIVKLWDVPALLGSDLGGAPSATRLLDDNLNDVWSVAFSPDGQWLASGSTDWSVRLWDAAALAAGADDADTEASLIGGHRGLVSSVVFGADSRWLASGGFDQKVFLWDLESLDPDTPNARADRYLVGDHGDLIWAVALSPDGRWLASGGEDKVVRVWEVAAALNAEETGSPPVPRVLPGHTDVVWSLAFSPDGRWLASASSDRTVRLWDASAFDREGTGAAAGPRILQGHEAKVLAVAFSPGGRWLASGGTDKTVRLWDMENPTEKPRVLEGHEDWVWSLAFSPDGQRLVSGSRDASTRVWVVPLEELVELGCTQARRNMTREEWEVHLLDEPYRATCPNLPALEEG